MNPMQIAANRTARLVAEAATPVYSTSTPVGREREHLMVIEIDSGMGRYWSSPMLGSKVDDYVAHVPMSYGISDIDCSVKCWCAK